MRGDCEDAEDAGWAAAGDRSGFGLFNRHGFVETTKIQSSEERYGSTNEKHNTCKNRRYSQVIVDLCARYYARHIAGHHGGRMNV